MAISVVRAIPRERAARLMLPPSRRIAARTISLSAPRIVDADESDLESSSCIDAGSCSTPSTSSLASRAMRARQLRASHTLPGQDSA